MQAILKTESENIARQQIKQDLPGAARGVLYPKAPVIQATGYNAPATLKPIPQTTNFQNFQNLNKPVTIPDQTKLK